MEAVELIRNISQIKQELDGTGCKLVAVSKTKPIAVLETAYQAGIRIFGENRAPEMAEKYEALPKDIDWHMIGHLQTNKVKLIAHFVAMIHSVDSFKLLKEINKRAKNADRVIPCLLQVHIAQEENKYGFSESEIMEILESEELKALQNIKIQGLMGMATYTPDMGQIQQEFTFLKELFNKLGSLYVADNIEFTELSMGMTNDFRVAIAQGSTMVRIGSLIFGERN